MGVKVIGAASFAAKLRAAGAHGVPKVYDVLEKGAQDIQKRAKEYAPIDEGNLEDAIVIVNNSTPGKPSFLVEVEDRPGENGGMSTLEYGLLMHEGLYPGSRYKLGKRSKEKAKATGKRVGGKFMSRAVRDFEKQILAKVRKFIQKGVI